MRRYTWALAILCFLVILLAAPLLISDRYSRIALQSGAVFAASTNSYSLSSPVRLMTGPTIDLESGTLSVPPSRTGLARGGQMIAMLITGNGPQMTLEKATFTADFSTREPTFSQDAGAGDVAPLVKALQRMQFDGLVVRDSTIRIKMSDGSVVELEHVNATISSKPNGAIHAARCVRFPRRDDQIRNDARREPRPAGHVATDQRLVLRRTAYRGARRQSDAWRKSATAVAASRAHRRRPAGDRTLARRQLAGRPRLRRIPRQGAIGMARPHGRLPERRDRAGR